MSLDGGLVNAKLAILYDFKRVVLCTFPQAEVRKNALWQNFYIIDGATLKTLSFPYSPSEDAAWERAAWQQKLLPSTS